jgi:hypothetical protein
MKPQTLALATLSVLIAQPALATDHPAALADCKEYALEDGVGEVEMESYLAQCAKELTEAEGDDGAASEEGSGGASNQGY